MIGRLAIATLLGAGILVGAAAFSPPEDQAGEYTLARTTEGPDVCRLTLTREPAIGGWAINLGADCAALFDLGDDIAAWTVGPEGQIRFIDPLRKPVLSFEPTEIGGYVAERPGLYALSLDPAVD
jgi:hypothetical protein